MSSETLPAKGAGDMQFSSQQATDLWGRSRTDPKWYLDGSQLSNGKGNKLKLKDGKWVSA